MRIRAAQDRTVQHARQADVVDKCALAADEPRVFLARDRDELAVPGEVRGLGHGADPAADRPASDDSASLAHSTDRTMFSYPVHRQIWPDIASRISGSVGCGLRFSSQRAVSIMPGV